jgi:branched-chain amino acid transport system substrate-binding protein
VRRLISLFVFPISMLLAAMPAHGAQMLRIGIVTSLTGKYAEFGKMHERAYKLWEADVNRRGGLLGKQVKLTILDNKSDPQVAKALYQDLIAKQKVDLILGPYSSEITQVVADVAEQYHYPLLASGASAESLWQQGRKYLFGVYVTTPKYTLGFLELLVQKGINKIAVVSANDPFSRGIDTGTKEWADRFDLDIVFSQEFNQGDKLEKVLRRAQQSGAQALIISGYLDDAVNARIALKKNGWVPKAFYATVGPAVQKYEDILKSDANYTFTSSQWEPNAPFPGAREFTQSFIHAYHVAPSYQAATAYAAAQILEAAIRKNQSADRSKLRDTLATLDVITVIGRYGVDSSGKQVRHFTTTVQWQHGKKEIVGPREMMTAEPIWR